MQRAKKISFGTLAIICYVLSVLFGWSYGNSYAIYASMSITVAIIIYYRFFFKSISINKNVKLLAGLLVALSLFIGTVNGDFKSSFLVNTSTLAPLALCSFRIGFKNFKRQIAIASILSLCIIFYITIMMNPLDWNPNALAFMIFGGASIGMMWFKVQSHRLSFSSIMCIVYMFLAVSYLLLTGCRNAGMVIVVCIIMLLLPVKIYKIKYLYRTLYIVTLFLTIFAADFMQSILSDEKAMEEIMTFTKSFSDKEWGMDSHYILLNEVSEKFANKDLFSQLFGIGIKAGHCHNLYYQCLYFYGYVGTFMIYMFFIYVFEKAYKMIKDNDDIIVLSCFIILIGHFLLQIGEVYMLGSETANLIALLPASVILQRWYIASNGKFQSTRII